MKKLHRIVIGKVTQRQLAPPMYFYVDDGSSLRDGTTTGGVENVGLKVAADPTGCPEGAYVAVKGVVSCFNSSGPRRQLLASEMRILQEP
jgi:hypothetical protein